MVEGLLGKKVGMTQIFDEDGKAIPVTIIQAGPCVVVQKKTVEKEGYSSVQLGLVEKNKVRVTKPAEGHFKKAGVPPTRLLTECAFTESEEEQVNVGDQVLVQNVFQPNDFVDVLGCTKGRGFQGVMKRHGFHGGKATHGSMFHRAPGSIGASAYPSRVMKGTKLPGRMGNKRRKIRNLKVVEIDGENNLLVVKGAVPGSRGTYLTISRSLKGASDRPAGAEQEQGQGKPKREAKEPEQGEDPGKKQVKEQGKEQQKEQAKE
jgi:large subunit ribosomal protein L3